MDLQKAQSWQAPCKSSADRTCGRKLNKEYWEEGNVERPRFSGGNKCSETAWNLNLKHYPNNVQALYGRFPAIMSSQTSGDFLLWSCYTLDFGVWGGSPVVETPHFLLSGRSGSETNQQILFVAVFSKQPLEILFATLILGWKAVRGGEPFSHGVSLVRVRQCGSYKKERESGGEEAVNFLRTNIGNVKNVNSVF